MRAGRGAELAALVVLVGAAWLGLASAGLPRVAPASAPAAEFSAERALTDLKAIAIAPHPVGTTAHDRVRDYLVDRLRALGCDDVHVQSATGFNTLDGPLAATVANVVARKRGSRTGQALVLAAHYDAVPRSYGAGDDGAGVAAILETLRALQNLPPLANDVIVVFSDAEENGLLGAEAFVDLHPWAKDARVVLNFEGRGDTGPVFMFQTSAGNRNLVAALAASVPDARTNSLTGEVYRHLPSDTDLSVWLHSSLPIGALNFAHVGGYPRYHTPMDDVQSLDPRVLQHMGDYTLGLARELGRADLAALTSGDAVYFNAPLAGVIHYPAGWAVPLAVFAMLAVLVVAAAAARRRVLSVRGFGRGAGLMIVTIAAPVLVTFAGWRIIGLIHPGYREILQRDPYNSVWYLICVGALTIAFGLEAQRRFIRRSAALELAMAPLIAWGLLSVATAVMLPGASYLLLWPLLAATAGAVGSLRSSASTVSPSVVATLAAVPAVVLWPPLIHSLEVALTAERLTFCAALAALVMTLLVIPASQLGSAGRWVIRGTSLLGITALVVAETTAGFSATRKRPDSLSYLVSADSARAAWVSLDGTADAWTAAVLGDHPLRRPFDAYRIAPTGDALLFADAGPVPVPPTPVRVVENDSVAEGRRLHLHIARSGPGEILWLYLDTAMTITQMVVNDRALPDGAGDRYSASYHPGRRGTVMRYFGVPEEGVDLRFTMHSAAAQLHVVTAVEGLPATGAGPLPARPPEMMSKPFVATDMTIIHWTVGTKPTAP